MKNKTKNRIVCQCTCPCVNCRASSNRAVVSENSDTASSDVVSIEIDGTRLRDEVEVNYPVDSDQTSDIRSKECSPGNAASGTEETDSDSTIITQATTKRKAKDSKIGSSAEASCSEEPAKRAKVRPQSPVEVEVEESSYAVDASVDSANDSSEKSDQRESESYSEDSKSPVENEDGPRYKASRKGKRIFLLSDSDENEDEDRSEQDEATDSAEPEPRRRAKNVKKRVRSQIRKKNRRSSSSDDDDDQGDGDGDDQGDEEESECHSEAASEEEQDSEKSGSASESGSNQDSEEDTRKAKPRRSARIQNRARSRSSSSSPRKGKIEFSDSEDDGSESEKSCTTSEESEPEDLSKRVCLLCKNLGKKKIFGRSQLETSEWCKCSKCEATPGMRDYDRVCCMDLLDVVVFRKDQVKVTCITEHPRFELEVLEFRALHRTGYYRSLSYNNTDSFMAQWSFRRWIWDRLSSLDRIMVPACVRAKIVQRFPDEGTRLFDSVGDKYCRKKIHCRRC